MFSNILRCIVCRGRKNFYLLRQNWKLASTSKLSRPLEQYCFSYPDRIPSVSYFYSKVIAGDYPQSQLHLIPVNTYYLRLSLPCSYRVSSRATLTDSNWPRYPYQTYLEGVVRFGVFHVSHFWRSRVRTTAAAFTSHSPCPLFHVRSNKTAL